MEIIDNFLPTNEFNKIKNFVLDSDFPWQLKCVIPTNPSCSPLENYQLNHTFYIDDLPKSPYFEKLFPLFMTLKPCSIMRVRANCNINTHSIVEHGMHKDYEFDSWAAVYYLNTCNGYTRFKSGEKVDSVANRMLKFKANELHTGSTCTDSLARYVININYF